MHRSFTSGIILKWYHETEQNFKNVQSDKVCGGRDISRVAIAVDGIDVPQIDEFVEGLSFWDVMLLCSNCSFCFRCRS